MTLRIRAVRRVVRTTTRGGRSRTRWASSSIACSTGSTRRPKRIEGLAKPPAGTVANAQGAAGFLMSHEENDAVTVINRAFKGNGDVYWLKSPLQANGKTYPAGTYFVSASALPVLQKSAADLGVNFVGVPSRPARRNQSLVEAHRALRSVRRIDAVGLDAPRVREFRDSL